MNTVEIISLIITSGIMLRVVEHFLTRKQQKKTAAKSHIENIDLASETWHKVVSRLEERIEKLINQQTILRDENIHLREEVYKLREELAALKEIQKKCDKYDRKINELQKKIEKYERLLDDNNIDY